ncbi:dihydroorotate dehydrogenase 2, partial [archaeon]
MPALRALDAESSHDAAIWTLSQGVGPKARAPSPDEERLLATRLWGLNLRNPVGLAAGFDKHARAVRGCMDLGFGLVEIGSITPMAQEGNPRPRMFRLTEDAGVINRYGFNSEGVRSVASRLAAHWSGVVAPLGEGAPLSVAAGQGWPLLGVNIGKNKEGDAVADYCDGIRALAPFADYLVINVSSPNTPGLRTLQR